MIHLLYASIVWLAAWLLTSMPRGSATTKYWIWVATSLNFALPLSAIPARLWPAQLGWFTPRRAPSIDFDARVIAVVWAIGAAAMLARLWFRLREERRGPSVVGFVRPRILLPDGIDRLLTERELAAVLLHERRHARRRDNLIGLGYELSLCALWFHPLVWMAGSRLALFRELSCDEAVPRGGDLLSALAKLAVSDDASLLQSTASSFVRRRVAVLTQPRRSGNLLLIVAFGVVLFAGVVGPIAVAVARWSCTH